MHYTAFIPLLVAGAMAGQMCPTVPVTKAQSFPVCCGVIAVGLNNLYTGTGAQCMILPLSLGVILFRIVSREANLNS